MYVQLDHAMEAVSSMSGFPRPLSSASPLVLNDRSEHGGESSPQAAAGRSVLASAPAASSLLGNNESVSVVASVDGRRGRV